VYPTRQQTGAELFQLTHLASGAFERVALYFENSILPPDWALLPGSIAPGRVVGNRVESPKPTGVAWKGAALVDGKPWPVQDGEVVWLPAGKHTLSQAPAAPTARLLDLNAQLMGASVTPDGMEFSYRSQAGALARLDRQPEEVLVDQKAVLLPVEQAGDAWVLRLPRGAHSARMRFSSAKPPGS